MQWAAFDFETATHARESACALGIVVVDDGEVTARQAWMIRPPDNHYSSRNIAIHGIRPADTHLAPAFDDVWAEAELLIGDRPLVAHNAAFDLSVLSACATSTGAVVRERPTWCSLRIARRAWPQLGRWNLPAVAAHTGAQLTHHDALSDAQACSHVVRRCIDEQRAPGLAALGRMLDLEPRATAVTPQSAARV